ncbi:MAG TPA: MmcQ/YjbR family DNA-binding protein [Chitinophagaceae bacterium]
MITIEQARKAALSLPETEEKPHFDLTSFRVKNKIFSTIHADKNYVMVKLSAIDQSVFCAFDKEVIFPVPGGWGKQGATFINLKKVKKSMLLDALSTAWKTTAPPKLVEKYFGKEKS